MKSAWKITTPMQHIIKRIVDFLAGGNLSSGGLAVCAVVDGDRDHTSGSILGSIISPFRS